MWNIAPEDKDSLRLPAQNMRRKSAGGLIYFLVLLAGGVWLIYTNDVVGWPIALLSIFLICMGTYNTIMFWLHPRSCYLKITPEGLTIRFFHRSALYRWSDISGFGIATIPPSGLQTIGFTFAAGYKKKQKMRMLNQAICGYDGSIINIYGIPIDELLHILNTYKQRYAEGDLRG